MVFLDFRKPYETIKFDLESIGNKVNDCVPASFTEINNHYGGKLSYEEMSSRVKYIEGVGVQDTPRNIFNNAKALLHASDVNLSQLLDPGFAQNLRNNDNIVTLMMKISSGMSHMDNIRAIKYYSSKTMVQLRIGNYKLDELIKMSVGALSVSGLRY